MLKISFLLPNLAPIIETIIDSTQPLQITIQSELIQKFGSMMAEIIPMMLHNTGTYQILFGFCLQI